MDRTAIKNFATWARTELREQVTTRLKLFGITAIAVEEPQAVAGGLLVAGQTLDDADAKLYELLRKHLDELVGAKRDTKALAAAVDALVDELAYTWFNRLAALRYMEVNGYLRRRALSSEDQQLVDPQLLRDAGEVAELEDLPGLTLAVWDEWQRLAEKEPNPDEFLYRRLLAAQCRELAKGLPFLFEASTDYRELFLPANLLNQDSIVRRLVNYIPEEDWLDSSDSENGVEIIGWLYQFYISERKDEVIGAKGKIAARDIPAATQLFTPHWIVRYMVENSLGRLWLEAHPESNLRAVMPYFLENPPAEDGDASPSSSSADNQLNLTTAEEDTEPALPQEPQELTVMDPACGSGHILVYAFDLLFQIYKEQGYPERDIPGLILEHNLHGLDIDERAVQLASFAVLMKARAKNPRILRRPVKLNIVVVRSTRELVLPSGTELSFFNRDWTSLLETYEDADNLGSLIQLPPKDIKSLQEQLQEYQKDNSLFWREINALSAILKQTHLLTQRYWTVIANPPYIGYSLFNKKLQIQLDKDYPISKGNLFSAFLEKTIKLTKTSGFTASINQHSWMFLKAYKDLRKKILSESHIVNMIHLGIGVFPDMNTKVVQSTAFVITKSPFRKSTPVFTRLVDNHNPAWKREKFLTGENRFTCYNQNIFRKIPGSPIAYWLSDSVFDFFESNPNLGDVFKPRAGTTTTQNDRFLRFWFEVERASIKTSCNSLEEAKSSSKTWFPYNKGGGFCKYFGNNEYLLNWRDDGHDLKEWITNHPKDPCSWSRYIRSVELFFQPGITWGDVTSGSPSFRLQSKGYISGSRGPTIFTENLYLLSYLNSPIVSFLLEAMNPTLTFNVGDISNLPVPKEITTGSENSDILENTSQILKLSTEDWNRFENSWSFKRHPLLLKSSQGSIKDAYSSWENELKNNFKSIKDMEEKNNYYWITKYGLQDSISHKIDNHKITIHLGNLHQDICSFISYAVGCMMGRYSLDEPSLIHAGQPFDANRHTKFPADDDAIIPITDQAYFDDDIVTRFIDFIAIAYGKETLTENLDFIANALKLKANETARQRIRRYFTTEFIKDHIKTYKKRPIYWLFTSGKKRAFGALIYLHRYSEDTLARIRTDYVLELQVKLDAEIERLQNEAATASTTSAKKAATQRLKILQDQQLELRDYQAKLQTEADKRIQLDLDDGVAYNYSRFKGLVYEGPDLKMKDLEKKAQWKLDLLKQAKPSPSP